jgi:VanZ family protein
MGARRLLPWLPAIAYMALIWGLSSQSQAIPLPDLPCQDKGAHFIEYAVLGALFAYATVRTWPRLNALAAHSTAVLLATGWGYIDELHQAFVPGRNSDARDWIADTLGAMAGVTIAALLDRVVRKLQAARAARS